MATLSRSQFQDMDEKKAHLRSFEFGDANRNLFSEVFIPVRRDSKYIGEIVGNAHDLLDLGGVVATKVHELLAEEAPASDAG